MMFRCESRVPTTPAHQQASRGSVTCLSPDRAESVTIGGAGPRCVVADLR
jgi:hypothetical protein